ncbi:hypothetical protein QJS04_geneDACA019065 [Acorus gramineus]|uniref:Allyl alcohol dehydrogenase-like protein n=1 Tax=Acorus gramineus TaxID=55184 RepID=A0AAV9AA24_ACOGR|nr:hypothetical protein QJS04_geneDACA019065 [Acorus gramineus]
MGILSWWRGKEAPATKPTRNADKSLPNSAAAAGGEVVEAQTGMNGAMEVPRRPADATVFEFGSAAASSDKVTLAGYCPVSEELEPCRWEILPSSGSNAPQFRVVF